MNVIQEAIAAKIASRINGDTDSETQQLVLKQMLNDDKVKLNEKLREEISQIRKEMAEAKASGEDQVVIDMYSSMLVNIAGLAS